MRQILAALLIAACGIAGLPAAAEPPPAGLVWNRSGLPAVFPLQVRTSGSRDYGLTLIDAKTGDAALRAFIKGGRFFQILVPPGTYRLRFATGETWQGSERMFGAGAEVIELDRPLSFAVRGIGTKAGHVVDLRGLAPGELAAAPVEDRSLCQTLARDYPSPLDPRTALDDTINNGLTEPWEPAVRDGSDLRDPLDPYGPDGSIPWASVPRRTEVRSGACD